MKPINPAFLSYLTYELNGGADIDELIHKYFKSDPNDPVLMKDIIRNILKPSFDQFPEIFKLKMKDCLGFYLSTQKIDFVSVYNGNLLPIDTPEDSQLFYVWIWEIFFENEDYNVYNNIDYFEMNDLNEPLNYYFRLE